jgi:hypothetical protein
MQKVLKEVKPLYNIEFNKASNDAILIYKEGLRVLDLKSLTSKIEAFRSNETLNFLKISNGFQCAKINENEYCYFAGGGRLPPCVQSPRAFTVPETMRSIGNSNQVPRNPMRNYEDISGREFLVAQNRFSETNMKRDLAGENRLSEAISREKFPGYANRVPEDNLRQALEILSIK